ncbi:Sec-independent protein translocase protein TatB [Roseitranquillus sediminis]|uniref:Sec-independent protein translocase protein TatB n=1 Tax=Roseitranquillus sediminis TaxID=2809051 RepID=UPI001D0C1F8D|nr:Sec-independent protein translocase protein TatB [Roseitranquillus sediminis]MBM9594087.1 twin-arginine translocase subunit TatB [Roseitranquillus sediminis]
MFDIGWTELLVIGIVALIVVGPKDLPGMFKALGQFTAKARGMAREFQRAMEDAADESGVKDMGRDMRNLTSAKNLGLDKLKTAARDLGKLDPDRKPRAGETARTNEERAAKAGKLRDAAAAKAEERREAARAQADAPAPEAPAPAAEPAAKETS